MKPHFFSSFTSNLWQRKGSFASTSDFFIFLFSEGRRRKYLLWLFLGLCANLIVAPAVFAANNGNLERTNAYALGLLGIVTFALAVYLFAVILQPERF